MKTKTPKTFRLNPLAILALEKRAEKEGKSKTAIIEDLLLPPCSCGSRNWHLIPRQTRLTCLDCGKKKTL
tara:strand:- start:186 stop:395 length:210 start_codon:yes stop_codon:yes gene_type:complete